MKSFKSFDKIKEESTSIFEKILNLPHIYAHSHEKKDYETLYEHTRLVVDYFELLVQQHRLEPCIDLLIEKISYDDDFVGNCIKKLFMHTLVFHDVGKVNPNFQAEKLKNPHFQIKDAVAIGTDHSFLSAYAYLCYHINEVYNNSDISSENKNNITYFAFLFTIPILKHHSTALAKDYEFDIDKTQSIHHLIRFLVNFESDYINKFLTNEKQLRDFFDDFIRNKSFDFFALFALIKLNWSLLTAADYYATTQYMNDLRVVDFGLINEYLRKKIIENFSACKSYNKELLEKIDLYLQTSPDQLDKSPYSLNVLRQRLGAEIWVNLEKYRDEHVFYIEAPTGSGKTNLSIIALRRILEFNPEINKVFYVFPFTTLITQTLKSIKETLGLTETEIAQIHSKAGIQSREKEADANYGNLYKNLIDNLFVNFPFTLITHIQFFDILKSNDKKSNYLLHRLTNSIVIIDEVQAYNPAHWDKVKYFISNYAKYFNIRFILMSATLPRLHNISIGENDVLKFNNLIENPHKHYFQNPNFCKRVYIKSELLEIKNLSLNDLANIVYEKSEKYAISKNNPYHGSVHTIIEFIFKRTATEFYNVVMNSKLFDDYEIFVLSGTIIEPRRKYIIEFLKDPANRSKKILVISTQVVEAGVDIDMDLGFKNQSIIDSDEQLAGRVNRNVMKDNCELYLFRYNEPQKIYGKDLRYEITKKLEEYEIQEILQEKKFGYFYDKIINKINQSNKSVYKDNFNDYKNAFKSLRFDDINSEFRLIESNTASIFVPLEVSIVCYKNELNFSTSELNFLKNQVICDDNADYVSGIKVWYYYMSLINNEIKSSHKGLEIKMLNSIISKFVFHVFANKINELMPYLLYNENQHAYNFIQYYLLNSTHVGDDKIYSYNSGLNDSKLKESFELI